MKKGLQGFTLVELLVVITILWIIGYWVTTINFNRITDKQKAAIFSNKITSSIEWVRNMILIGKSVDSTWFVPQEWSINLPINTPNSQITPQYLDSSSSLVNYQQLLYTLKQWEIIRSIQCKTIDGTSSTRSSWILTITFSKNTTTFNCNSPDERIVEILIEFQSKPLTIVFNWISNIVEKVY